MRSNVSSTSPISRASRPASTASLKARAIRFGSDAIAIAVFTENRVRAHLHRFRRLARRAQSSINHHRDGCLFDDDFDLRARFNPAIASDRRTERHHRRRANVLQSFRQHRIGIDVGQDGESFLHQNLRGRERLDRIGQQIARVGMNLELDPRWQSGAGGEPRESHRVIGIAGAAGVRQQEKFFGSMKSRMFANGSCLPERSARRSATVTISVPLAMSASRIASFEENFPVPTSNREVNSRSAIFNLEGLSDITETYSQLYRLRIRPWPATSALPTLVRDRDREGETPSSRTRPSAGYIARMEHRAVLLCAQRIFCPLCLLSGVELRWAHRL